MSQEIIKYSNSENLILTTSPATTKTKYKMSAPLSPLMKPRYGDRFIPARVGNTWQLNSSPAIPIPATPTSSESDESCDEKPSESLKPNFMYSSLLKNELLGCQFANIKDAKNGDKSTSNNKIFHFDTSERPALVSDKFSPYSLSPVSKKSESLLTSPRKPQRRICKQAFRMLDAPDLVDDFYLNLLDWSSANVISIGLGTCVYLWSAIDARVTTLCNLEATQNIATSVASNAKGNLVAVGTGKGLVQIYDVATSKSVSNYNLHSARVGVLAWNGDLISSGSRDRTIINCDVRLKVPPTSMVHQFLGHRQEICGLKWSPDNQLLASGGNDNLINIWSLHSATPIQTYNEHTAAVKAISWSPYQHGLLATGGGTKDQCIRFWNTLSNMRVQCIDTGSQVCNLLWSKHSPELVTTHGYSHNEIMLWKYPSMQKLAKLRGHTQRVLYMAMAPDGETIVTGAADESLRFWNLLSRRSSLSRGCNKSLLSLYNSIR